MWWLAGALAGAVVLYVKYRRDGETQTLAVDAIDSIVSRWALPRGGAQFLPLFDAASARYGLPIDLLPAVAYRESRFRADIISGATRSSAGAVGIMQILPSAHPDIGEAGALDPAQAIPYAAKFLRDLYARFREWPKAIAAYNFGPGNVAAGKPWPAETRGYVAEVTANAGLAS
jgi:soluble lytic murein transglycosylase-like protein